MNMIGAFDAMAKHLEAVEEEFADAQRRLVILEMKVHRLEAALRAAGIEVPQG